jgi:hypothetical protein
VEFSDLIEDMQRRICHLRIYRWRSVIPGLNPYLLGDIGVLGVTEDMQRRICPLRIYDWRSLIPVLNPL